MCHLYQSNGIQIICFSIHHREHRNRLAVINPDKQARIQPRLSVKAAEKLFSIRDARDASLVRWKQITFVSLHLGEKQVSCQPLRERRKTALILAFPLTPHSPLQSTYQISTKKETAYLAKSYAILWLLPPFLEEK
jgi:hypothetical protein